MQEHVHPAKQMSLTISFLPVNCNPPPLENDLIAFIPEIIEKSGH